MTPRPKDGSPWIVPANEAKGAYFSTIVGPKLLVNYIPENKLRPDQTVNKPKSWFVP